MSIESRGQAIIEKYKEYKETVIKLEERLKFEKEAIKKEFGVDTVEELEKLIESTNNRIEKLTNKIEPLLQELEEALDI